MGLCLYVFSVTVLTYYKIVFLSYQDLKYNILDNINYVDNALQFLHVEVPYMLTVFSAVQAIYFEAKNIKVTDVQLFEDPLIIFIQGTCSMMVTAKC